MKWHYVCPCCQEWQWVEWDDRRKLFLCNKDKTKSYFPPAPSDQHSAYVDTHNWPQEMEETVISMKGNLCTVPGCRKIYETLDHRLAFNNGGKTSVDNLFPMCNFHNQSKGDNNYQTWVEELKQSDSLRRYLYG